MTVEVPHINIKMLKSLCFPYQC